MGVNGVYKKSYFLLKVTQEFVSGQCVASECAVKWKEGLYDEIIITIVPGYTGKNITHLLPLQTHKNTV